MVELSRTASHTGSPAPPAGWSAAARSARSALLVALPAWLLARVLLAVALGVVAWLHGGRLPEGGAARPATGLLVWDSGWYHAITQQGYAALGRQSLRFFPLTPLAGRSVGELVGDHPTVGLLLVTNVAALLFAVLVVVLVRQELGDEGIARRSAWLVTLAPGAGVLALGYAEPVAGALAVAFFLLLRRGRVGAVTAVGLASGLSRPTAVLLAVPAVIELFGTGRPYRARWAARLLAAASPLLGAAAYCAWCWARFGDPLLPYTVQTDPNLRGGLIGNPLTALTHTAPGGQDWRLNLVVLAIAAALLVLVVRRLPASYAAWAALMLAAGVTSTQLHSLPRYCAAVFPLAIAAAIVVHRRASWLPTITVCAGLMSLLAGLGFAGHYVP